MEEKLINACQCPVCKEVLVSTHRHDFVSCQCGNFTDGGNDYIRRGGPNCFDLIHIATQEDLDEIKNNRMS